MIEQTKKDGTWLVLAGHEISAAGGQTTRTAMLEKLSAYAQNPANGLWIAPVGKIAKYVREQRRATQ